MASTSDCPCTSPPGHCWLALAQLAELSKTKMTFGNESEAASLVRPLANKSISSALATLDASEVSSTNATLDMNPFIAIPLDRTLSIYFSSYRHSPIS